MAYDWSGGRTRRFRRFKLGMAFGLLLLLALAIQAFFGAFG
ncbi:hypothetical protein [Rhizobium sp. Leaf262]|nr:hypothetical protein [Rhizobium sp. Leaf262]